MSEMIERVARAIVVSRGLDPDKISVEDGKTPIWKYHLENARAAIEAMREPTPEMEAAFHAACDEHGHVMWRYGWKAMIDQALEVRS